MGKDDRKKESELLKLTLSLKSIGSNYLEPRINGMKDLNMLIKNNTMYHISKTFTTEFLIQWITDNGLL